MNPEKRTEERLRALLADATPESPGGDDRAAGARRYAVRRRRRAIGGVAAVLTVAAIAVGVPLAVQAGDGDPLPADDTVTDVSGSCPPPRRDTQNWTPVTGPDTVPDGAVSVRLCNPGGAIRWQQPSDALTTDVDEVAAAVNRLPEQPGRQNQACPMDLGPTWDLVFTWPDGRTQTVRGESFGCGGVEVGSVVRGGRDDGEQPLNRFTSALVDQRAASTPPEDLRVSLACDNGLDGPATTMVPDGGEPALTRAVLCRMDPQRPGRSRSIPIPEDDLAVLTQDLRRHRSSGSDTCGRETNDLQIVGQNAWGDRVVISGDCGGFFVAGGDEEFWNPGPKARTVLDRLTRGLR